MRTLKDVIMDNAEKEESPTKIAHLLIKSEELSFDHPVDGYSLQEALDKMDNDVLRAIVNMKNPAVVFFMGGPVLLDKKVAGQLQLFLGVLDPIPQKEKRIPSLRINDEADFDYSNSSRNFSPPEGTGSHG